MRFKVKLFLNFIFTLTNQIAESAKLTISRILFQIKIFFKLRYSETKNVVNWKRKKRNDNRCLRTVNLKNK